MELSTDKDFIVPSDQIFLARSYIDKCETWDEFTSLGGLARELKDKSQWYLGMLALKVVKKYGENSIKKYAKDIRMVVSTLENYRWVVGKYTENNPQFVPPGKISFSALQSAASLPEAQRNILLENADIDGMSVERTRVEVAKMKGKKIPPPFHTEYCALHDKWIMILDNINQWEPNHE